MAASAAVIGVMTNRFVLTMFMPITSSINEVVSAPGSTRVDLVPPCWRRTSLVFSLCNWCSSFSTAKSIAL
ncbi:unannotated protein [freshwater metagenome]|uniref:Unannotated protein n=1 Tax=freshwater metagenome TaxID=449393 RepID=A0A6J6VMH3_9ZZZZ